jgi:predicted DNA-binding transcriptional regulator AlpA
MIKHLTATPDQHAETVQILGVEQVAIRLGLPKSSIYELTRFRSSNAQLPIPCRRIGRHLKFLSSDIDEWLFALPLTVNRTKRQYRRKAGSAKASATAASSSQPALLVPVSEAARLLSVSAWEIRRLCRKGALSYKKLGRTKWLVVSRSIAAFAAEVAR